VLDGCDHATATARALDTAGRSVLFAGCTVIIALLGLLVLGLGSLPGLALSVALTVLMTMLASTTLLPALLSLFGRRLESTVRRRATRRGRRHGDSWRRWAALVQRRPVAGLAAAGCVLVLLTLPILDVRLGSPTREQTHRSRPAGRPTTC
jgi:RND superfamily putative drug exporter